MHSWPVSRVGNVPDALGHLGLRRPAAELQRMPGPDDHGQRDFAAQVDDAAHHRQAVELPPKRPVAADDARIGGHEVRAQQPGDGGAGGAVRARRHGEPSGDQPGALAFAPGGDVFDAQRATRSSPVGGGGPPEGWWRGFAASALRNLTSASPEPGVAGIASPPPRCTRSPSPYGEDHITTVRRCGRRAPRRWSPPMDGAAGRAWS